MGELIPLTQWAESHAVEQSTARRWCRQNQIAGASKMGRDWAVPADVEPPQLRPGRKPRWGVGPADMLLPELRRQSNAMSEYADRTGT